PRGCPPGRARRRGRGAADRAGARSGPAAGRAPSPLHADGLPALGDARAVAAARLASGARGVRPGRSLTARRPPGNDAVPMGTVTRDVYFRLYAADVSYFSAKVRPAFRYKRVPYVEVLPTRAAYREVIRPRTGLAMIPLVITPEDDTWQDSSDILDALE